MKIFQKRQLIGIAIKALKFFAIEPHFHFVSTVPVSVSVERSKQKFEPFPDSPSVLSKRLELYIEKLKLNPNLIFIDGLRDKNEISQEIKKLIFSS